MKKALALTAMVALLLPLSACGSKGEAAEKPDTPEERLAAVRALAESRADVEALYEAIGEPIESSYASSCLGDGEDGQLEYEGFTVYTYRDPDGGEAVQDVLEAS